MNKSHSKKPKKKLRAVVKSQKRTPRRKRAKKKDFDDSYTPSKRSNINPSLVKILKRHQQQCKDSGVDMVKKKKTKDKSKLTSLKES